MGPWLQTVYHPLLFRMNHITICRGKDKIWNYGYRCSLESEEIMCTQCFKHISGSIRDLKEHFAGITDPKNSCQFCMKIVCAHLREKMKVKTSTMLENSSSIVPRLVPDTHEENELEKVLEKWNRNASECIKQHKEPSGAFELMTRSIAHFLASVGAPPEIVILYIMVGSRKDPGWNHCTRVDGNRHKTQCNYCGKERVRELRRGAGPSCTTSQERRDLEAVGYFHADIDKFQGYRLSQFVHDGGSRSSRIRSSVGSESIPQLKR
ncbi:hypothetical protein H6P81_003277 [Aristolochia fimbriata]|uniref:Uncharacterized protein n=1 Tax=Aristolochia fimbriata TaxID=158543 RepID=A0AAV7FDZ8_ARIFI|nr:hypothetical protein H6P81_003277 [Aristolochia fimbriata]